MVFVVVHVPICAAAKTSTARAAPKQPSSITPAEAPPNGGNASNPDTPPTGRRNTLQGQTRATSMTSLTHQPARGMLASSRAAHDMVNTAERSSGTTRNSGCATHVAEAGELAASEPSSSWVAMKAREASRSARACATGEDADRSAGVAAGVGEGSKKPPRLRLAETATCRQIRQDHEDFRTGWEKQYKAECQQHMIAIMLVMRAELMALVDNMPEVVRFSPI